MKVLYVSRGYTTHDHRFLSSFVTAGWSPTHLPMLAEKLETRPLPAGVESLRWTTDLRDPCCHADWSERRDRLAEIVRRMRPDAVIAGPIQSGAFVATLARATPLVAVSWGSDMLVDADATDFSRFVTRHTLAASDVVFGDCQAVREAVRRHSCIADDRIVTFPWGIEIDRFSPALSSLTVRNDLGWAGSEIFISTRSWEPIYAIDVLVRAFATVARSRPSARLLLLGDGSQQLEIQSLIEKMGIGHIVHTPGRVAYVDLPEYFRLADAYVSSALSDGTSVSLLEAMACGLPVVVSRSFGNLEWVEQGVNGALATPGSADSLSAAMASLPPMGSGERSRIAAANVASARTRANWEMNFPSLAKVVENLASGSRVT
ncbi:MAG: glycosyltransferase [Gemmatimonadaceae bacterium]